MKKIQQVAKKLMKIEKKSRYLSIVAVAMMIFMAQASVVFASALDGNTIKNNLIDNYVKPAYIVIFLVLLVKDFVKKNVASAILIFVVGGIVGILVFEPDLIKSVSGVVKGIFGL